ncbi:MULTISPECIES: hypothetical protein [Brevibacterium]|uniref:Uncharacterized protein n=1 Tax=Brevibacterium antiquum CNRZ 918 TaxID=1255637 RepID=A0A2H1KWS8_9MICO|nr:MULTISPECIES: hypothetical protein [Brevibacterium]SMY04099.1 hypothetical protein BANT918_02975 [Brevibacterium antiquum CNRZ 918]HCG55504.1 hypothetical protein [Brevibacterium sp.]
MDELILPSKAYEKHLAEVQDFLASVGMVATARCQYCGAAISDPKSLTARAGSVCRTRHAKNDPGATPAKKSRTEAA